jgi:hypothetical protein
MELAENLKIVAKAIHLAVKRRFLVELNNHLLKNIFKDFLDFVIQAVKR